MTPDLLTHLTPEEQAICTALINAHTQGVYLPGDFYDVSLTATLTALAQARRLHSNAQAVIQVQRAALTEARGAMEKYGRHQDHCAVLTNLHDAMCTCGYEAARTGREGTA